MNERVMQFRIGMFVIVAGLVLTMLIVWFGESPTMFRNYRYLTVHYEEAPGAAPGIPVRKSGVRIGEIASIKFDDRPNMGDGVLVTLAIEPAFRLTGSVIPRIGRALIGDISLDILPGTDEKPVLLSKSVEQSLLTERIIEGTVSPDPANTLAQASLALEQAGPTLEALRAAAEGISSFTGRSGSIDELVVTWNDTGQKAGVLAEDLRQLISKNESKIDPALTSMIEAFDSISDTLDPQTRENVRSTVKTLATGAVRLDQLIKDVAPLAADLGAPYGAPQTTQVGQVLTRLNRMAFEVGLLTAQLADPTGKRLNTNGTLQKLITDERLYDNLNVLITAFREFLASADPVVRNMNTFTERIARDPSALGRGILDR